MADLARGVPEPRTIVHPGPRSAVRIEPMQAPRARHFRLSLAPGRTLFDAIVQALAGAGVGSASMTLLGGDLATVAFCLPRPDPTGRLIATYGAPNTATGARLIFGNATFGHAADEAPVVHCHAVFRAADGTVCAGHLLTESALVGGEPVTVLATALDGFELRMGFDDETRLPMLRPKPQVPRG